MAGTRNVTVGPEVWTRIASAAGEGDTMKVAGSGPFVLAITLGRSDAAPEFSTSLGHRVSGDIELPLVGRQHLWASAATSTTLTVT